MLYCIKTIYSMTIYHIFIQGTLYVCVCVTIAECSAILLVLKTDQGDETEGWKREGLKMEEGKGQIEEGGCEL